MKRIMLAFILILSFIQLGCGKEKVYSIDDFTNDPELAKSIYARCSAGELSMKSETCENAEKVAHAQAIQDSFN